MIRSSGKNRMKKCRIRKESLVSKFKKATIRLPNRKSISQSLRNWCKTWFVKKLLSQRRNLVQKREIKNHHLKAATEVLKKKTQRLTKSQIQRNWVKIRNKSRSRSLKIRINISTQKLTFWVLMMLQIKKLSPKWMRLSWKFRISMIGTLTILGCQTQL